MQRHPICLYFSFAANPGNFTAQAQAGKGDDMADMAQYRHGDKKIFLGDVG